MIRDALKFGTFVLVCLGFLGWLAFTIGNIDLDDPLGRDNYTLTATFDDVTGLLIDDNVKVAGVVVGKVTDIETRAGQAVVTFQVDQEHDDIPRDSAAAIRWRNLIGQRYLYLHPGTDDSDYDDGDRIEQTRSVTDLGNLVNRLGPLAGALDPQQLNEVFVALDQALDGNEGSLDDIVGNLGDLVATLRSRDDTIGQLVTDYATISDALVTRDEQVRTMIGNLVELSKTFADNRTLVDRSLVELAALSRNLDVLLTANEQRLGTVVGQLAGVSDIVADNLDTLEALQAALPEMVVALAESADEGEWVNVQVNCLSVEVPPCPYKDQSATAGAGDTGEGRPRGVRRAPLRLPAPVPNGSVTDIDVLRDLLTGAR
jgi:phospholipid/cholesterol/gamma-HCH transport system substrate-binding protein